MLRFDHLQVDWSRGSDGKKIQHLFNIVFLEGMCNERIAQAIAYQTYLLFHRRDSSGFLYQFRYKGGVYLTCL